LALDNQQLFLSFNTSGFQLSKFHTLTAPSSIQPPRSILISIIMFSKRNHEFWKGALRVVAAIVAAIWCLSIITLGLSAAYGTQLASD